jgi:hypothetical protein
MKAIRRSLRILAFSAVPAVPVVAESFFAQVYFDPERKTGGAFFTTGGFTSFEALGNAVRLFFDKLLEETERL